MDTGQLARGAHEKAVGPALKREVLLALEQAAAGAAPQQNRLLLKVMTQDHVLGLYKVVPDQEACATTECI